MRLLFLADASWPLKPRCCRYHFRDWFHCRLAPNATGMKAKCDEQPHKVKLHAPNEEADEEADEKDPIKPITGSGTEGSGCEQQPEDMKER